MKPVDDDRQRQTGTGVPDGPVGVEYRIKNGKGNKGHAHEPHILDGIFAQKRLYMRVKPIYQDRRKKE